MEDPAPKTSAKEENETDIFESSLNLEETLIKEGYNDGYNQGLITGKEEAREVGSKTGFEAGEELGFYKGCVVVWKSVILSDPNRLSSRVQKLIYQMQDLIDSYPEDDVIDALRLKFRVVRAALGFKLEYDGYPKPKEIEF